MAEHIIGLVDKATSEYLIGTDYGLNIELSDFLNNETAGAPIAIKQIAKKLNNKKSRCKLLALELVETLVKNCEYVHPCVGSKEFQADMIKLVQSKKTKDNVKERALEIIQYWADSFRERRDLAMFGQTYELLRRTGVVFPARRKEEQLLVFKQKQPPRASPVPGGAPSQGARPQTGLGEFASVNESALLALEMINYIIPEEEDPDHNEALKDLVLSCRESAPKVRGVIESGNFASEQAMEMLLALNDDLMKVSEKFDELVREHKEFVQTGTIKSRKSRARTPEPAPLKKSIDFLDFSDVPTAPMANMSVGGAPHSAQANSNSITNLMGSFDFIGPPSMGAQSIAPVAQPLAPAAQPSQQMYNPFGGGYPSNTQQLTQFGQQPPPFAPQPSQYKPQATQPAYNPYAAPSYANPVQTTGGYTPNAYQPAPAPYGSQALVAQPSAPQSQVLQPNQVNAFNPNQAQQPFRPQQPAPVQSKPAQSKPDDFDDFAMLASSRHATAAPAAMKPAAGPMAPGQHLPGQNVMTSLGMGQVASSAAYPNYGQANPFAAPAQTNPYGGYPGQQQQPNPYAQPQNTYAGAGANPYAQQQQNQQQRR